MPEAKLMNFPVYSQLSREAKGRRVHTYVLVFLRLDRSDHDVARKLLRPCAPVGVDFRGAEPSLQRRVRVPRERTPLLPCHRRRPRMTALFIRGTVQDPKRA